MKGSKMGEVGEAGETEAEAARISRRRALKAGLAAGVGVTAWAGPQIGRMGATPAYAHLCTTPNLRFVLDDRNTDCSCQGTIAYHKFTGGTVNFAHGSATLTHGPAPACGAAVANKKCPDGSTTPGVCISVTTAGMNCKAQVELYQSSNPSVVIGGGSGIGIITGPGTGFSVLPKPAVSGNLCNTRVRVLVVCNTHIHCL